MNGLSVRELATMLDVNHTVIRRRIKDAGLQPCGRHHNRDLFPANTPIIILALTYQIMEARIEKQNLLRLERDWETGWAYSRTFPAGSCTQRPQPNEWYALRAIVFARDNNLCVYCGQWDEYMECDHMIPISRGGTNGLDNLATACWRCNTSKNDRTPEEWAHAFYCRGKLLKARLGL